MIIGYDPGYGNSKAARLGVNGTLQTAHLPSIVGVGHTELGLLDTTLGNRRRRDETPNKTTFDNVTYLVGRNVAASRDRRSREDLRPPCRADGFYASV